MAVPPRQAPARRASRDRHLKKALAREVRRPHVPLLRAGLPPQHRHSAGAGPSKIIPRSSSPRVWIRSYISWVYGSKTKRSPRLKRRTSTSARVVPAVHLHNIVDDECRHRSPASANRLTVARCGAAPDRQEFGYFNQMRGRSSETHHRSEQSDWNAISVKKANRQMPWKAPVDHRSTRKTILPVTR